MSSVRIGHLCVVVDHALISNMTLAWTTTHATRRVHRVTMIQARIQRVRRPSVDIALHCRTAV